MRSQYCQFILLYRSPLAQPPRIRTNFSRRRLASFDLKSSLTSVLAGSESTSTQTFKQSSRSFAMIAQTPTPPPTGLSPVDDALWRYVMPADSTEAHYVYSQPIDKPERDDRQYKFIRLQNGLQAFLIHDETADQAAAALNVAVGHLSDPDDIPGLAHFCEHLLFMGTEQFPKENEYSEYLNKNGGSSNAYTAASNTNYYFSVNTNAFAGALERFSGFFHSPLFSPSCTTRELHAVHSEHKKNYHSDQWRNFQLTKHLSKDGHPWRKFGSGNMESLTAVAKTLRDQGTLVDVTPRQSSTSLLSPDSAKLPSPLPSRSASPNPSEGSTNSDAAPDGGAVGREIRRRLVEWWSKEYCASRMGLTIVAKESLDEITDLTVKYFSPIVNRGQTPLTMINDPIYGPEQKGTMTLVKTIMDYHSFEISFAIPYQAPLWRTKPGNILSHLVGHEGPGSLHLYLKNKGWINNLSSGVQNLGRGFALFKITVHLTKDGFENHQAAIIACFKYLSLLRSTGIFKRYQDELQTIRAIQFRFTEKTSPMRYVSSLAESIPGVLPPGQILNGHVLLWDWNESQVLELLDMLSVENARIYLMSKDFSSLLKSGEVQWAKEPIYGTEYHLSRFKNDFVTAAKSSNDIKELLLPHENEFLPTRLNVEKRDVVQPTKRPILLKQTPLMTLWHKKDDQFWVPRACVRIQLVSPKAIATARDVTLTRLYVDLVTDALTEHVYDAELAGLRSHVSQDAVGVVIRLEGFNDKLDVLTSLVLEKIRNIRVLPDRLAIMKQEMDLECQNWFLGQSYRICDHLTQYILHDGLRTVEEVQAEISSVEVPELQRHIADFLSKLRITTLVTGNVTKAEAIGISEVIERLLKTSPLPESDIPQDLSRILPNGCDYVMESPVPNPNQTNAGVTYYCHFGDVSNPRIRTLAYFLSHMISEPAFNVLRTKEQLGYIVFASAWTSTASIGLRILVQSEKDPVYVESRINAFLSGLREFLENMSEEQFDEHRRGLIHLWNEKDKNLNEECRSFWGHIQSGYLDFFRGLKDSVLLETVTREEILSLYSSCLDAASPSRSKLSVHLRPQKALPKHFSPAAAEAYLTLLRSHGVDVDEKEYETLTTDTPLISKVKAHWSNALLQKNKNLNPSVSKMLADAVDDFGTKFPAVGEGNITLKDGTVKVKDMKAFKKSLTLSQPAKPLETYHDLPISKF